MYTRQIEVSGDCYQRGVQIGRQLQDAILTNYKNQQEFYRCSENFDYQKWEQLCQRYVPAMQRWTPEVLEELKGMAQGAQRPSKRCWHWRPPMKNLLAVTALRKNALPSLSPVQRQEEEPLPDRPTMKICGNGGTNGMW